MGWSCSHQLHRIICVLHRGSLIETTTDYISTCVRSLAVVWRLVATCISRKVCHTGRLLPLQCNEAGDHSMSIGFLGINTPH